MLHDVAIVLMAAGAGIVLTLGGVLAREGLRRRPCADVLDMIEPSQVVMPLRCICTARLSFCDCAIDGVRNPRGAGRARGVTRRVERWNTDGSGLVYETRGACLARTRRPGVECDACGVGPCTDGAER